jgi:hypothetical protein
MPDPFAESPNFVNPAYATPQQREQIRKYAEQLRAGSLAGGKRPLDILANALMGYAANRQQAYAGEQERGARTEAANQLLQASRSGDVSQRVSAMLNPEFGQFNPALMAPQVSWGPGATTNVTTPTGSVSTEAPVGPLPGRPPVSPAIPPKGDMNLTGPDREVTGVDYGPTTFSKDYVEPNVRRLIPTLKAVSEAGASTAATSKQIGEDVQGAYSSIPLVQTLRQMKDTISAHGDKMVWGPTSDWVENLKRSIAQHAPGFFSEKELHGLAAADSFDKLSSQLQAIIGGKVGHTDATSLQNLRTIPGSHNSKEGANALIDMLTQAATLNSQFVMQNQARIGTPGFDYLREKNRFFEQNPLINPLTNNPIRVDLSAQNRPGVQQPQQGSVETKILNGKPYSKINGVWHEGM